MRCTLCGLKSAPTPHPHERIHCGCKKPLAFGDWLSGLLSVVGITPLRWSWLQWTLGLIEVPENSCGGCEARRAWLNTLGGKLSVRTDIFGRWLYRLIVRRT